MVLRQSSVSRSKSHKSKSKFFSKKQISLSKRAQSAHTTAMDYKLKTLSRSGSVSAAEPPTPSEFKTSPNNHDHVGDVGDETTTHKSFSFTSALRSMRSKSSNSVDDSKKPEHGKDDGEKEKEKEKEKHELTKLQEQISTRNEIIKNSYILNPCWKYVAYCCIILFSVMCVIVTTVWCVYFETTHLNIENEYANEIESATCINVNSSTIKYAISEETWINYNQTQMEIENILKNGNISDDWYINRLTANEERNSFGDNLSLLDRFLIELVISFLLSIFVYSPLIALFYPVLFNFYMYKKNPNKLTEGKFFSENNGFSRVAKILDLDTDKVDERGVTIRNYRNDIEIDGLDTDRNDNANEIEIDGQDFALVDNTKSQSGNLAASSPASINGDNRNSNAVNKIVDNDGEYAI